MAKLSFNIPCMILFCFLYFAASPATGLNNETDLSALLAFKNAINDPLGALNSWNETVHFCEWKGILCDEIQQNRVISINLNSQGLVGSLSPHLGNLSFLRNFSLQNNNFNGQIPEEIGRLRLLERVEFSNNSFSGEIPRNLSQCTNLTYLNLIDNHLTGTIIPELGSLLKLRALGLTKNSLSGTVPPFLGNLTSLVRLSLALCGLQGEIPESLAQLQSLEFINLSENTLIGFIPSGLYNMSNMSVFSMGHNQLQGSIPSDVGFRFPKLRVLDLGDNLFDGPLPVSLSNASLLEQIDLSSNKFTGQMIKDFRRLSALQKLFVSNNSLEGDINFISSLTNCTNLEALSVFGNLLSGSLPDSIANLSSHLSFLSISGNQIHGTIPLGIENLVGLTHLIFADNYLEGPIPMVIGKLSKLREIYLGANRLTNELPSSLGNLTLLIHVYLGQNNFYGRIPQTLSNCKNLLTLYLSDNNFNGSIPPEIISLSSISILFNLSYNALTGPIPLEVGSLINLKDLDLSHNKLSGSIPSTLKSCVMLERLHLEGNSLDGEIPDGLRALKGLEDLDLSQNNLSGPIPKLLGNVLNLSRLNLSFNRLQGEVPTEGAFQNESAISLEGNDNLCGGNAFLKLPPCLSKNSKKKHLSTPLKILIPVLGAGAVCVTLSACFYLFIYRRRLLQKNESFIHSFEHEFLRLSYADLLKATGGFNLANLLGSGRFGSVYRGILNNGRTSVAVKVLNLEVKGASKSFISECHALRGIRHRNLLKIMSICPSTDFQGNDFKALVYQFMANGSLEKWLHQKETKESEQTNLTMTQRLNIAINIASAVEYLHYGTDSIIVHGDLKPSNILLDENMTAHVGDFGLASVFSSIPPSHESSSIPIKGTIGYIPPEYGMSGIVSTQGDAYSYGILLLEMFTDIRPTDDDALKDQSSLHDLVSLSLPNQVMQIVDPIILQENSSTKIKNCLISILGIGVSCSKVVPRERMMMTDVVKELHKIKNAYMAE